MYCVGGATQAIPSICRCYDTFMTTPLKMACGTERLHSLDSTNGPEYSTGRGVRLAVLIKKRYIASVWPEKISFYLDIFKR